MFFVYISCISVCMIESLSEQNNYNAIFSHVRSERHLIELEFFPGVTVARCKQDGEGAEVSQLEKS